MSKEEAQRALASRFREINNSRDHCEEAWLIAQTLTFYDAPSLYSLLQGLREHAVQEIRRQLDTQALLGTWTFKPLRRGSTEKSWKRDYGNWRLIDITPEIARDPRMANVSVSTKLARQLRRAIREQIWLLKQYE